MTRTPVSWLGHAARERSAISAPATPPSVVRALTEIRGPAVSALLLRCTGEIDSLNAHELATTVADCLAQIAGTASELSAAPQALIVDLREVSFFGASAVTALVQSGDESLCGRGALRLVVGETRPVRLVVDALDLRDTFSVYDDLAAALDQRQQP